MKDFNLPEELTNLFIKSYRSQYGYRGWWEIVDQEQNVCDQYEDTPHWHKDRLIIILHSTYWNDNTYYHYFTINDGKIVLSVLGTRGNGLDIWLKEPVHCKSKIMKVKKYLEQKLKESLK